mmetsp:Transcript_746/g.1286  ORF Transcript_746/g.1286 Transcript_746/m.1286 type:complete len:822 (-) Transcript_746:261-2726(-)
MQEDLEKKDALMENLFIMQRKEEELASLIQSIDTTFLEMGFKIDNSTNVTKKKAPPNSGIRMKGKLSFRGKEKAEEYFDLMDVDNDGLLNFQDFRAIRGFSDPFGLTNATEVQSCESWRLFMDDCGLTPNSMGGIGKDVFRRYRDSLEQIQPMSDELVWLHMGFLPPKQKHWAFCKYLLNEQLDFRESRLPPIREAGPRDEIFVAEDLSYFFATAGKSTTCSKIEIAILMYERTLKRRLLDELLFKYSKRNLAKPDFGFKLDEDGYLQLKFKEDELKVTADDTIRVEKKNLLPWLVGVPVLFDTTEIYRTLIHYKYQFIRQIRRFESFARNMFFFGAHINDRLVFRDFPPLNKVPKSQQEITNLRFNVMVGDESRREGGLCGSFKLTKVDNTAAVFRNLHVHTDSGSVLVIDLLFHADTTEDEGVKCVQMLRQFLSHHLERELRGNKLFSGMVVTNALNESDDAKVLRLIFSYKRLVSFDGWLDHMLIPYSLTDFVTVLVGDFRSNFDINEMIVNRMTSLSESFAASLDITLGVKRTLIMQVLERLYLTVSAGVTKDQVAKHEQDKDPHHHNKEREEMIRRVERWQHLHPFFPAIKGFISYYLNSLKCMKNAVLKFTFSSLGELVHKLGIMNVDFGRTVQSSWTHIPGFLRETYNHFVEKYTKELSAKHDDLKKHLEKKKQEDDERRIREIMSKNEEELGGGEQNRKADDRTATLEKLKRLGIDTQGNDLFEEESSNPKDYIKMVNDETCKMDVMGFITIENLRKHVLGVHSVELITGKAKLSLSVQGFDIFDILPVLPSMQKVADANALKPKKVEAIVET